MSRPRIYNEPARRTNIYLCEDALREVRREAQRLDRSVNWVVERCVMIGLAKVRGLHEDDEQGAA